MLEEAKAALSPSAQTMHWITVEQPGDPSACSLDPDFQPTSPAADAIAFLQYTSGSTADPKGVMVSQGNVSSNERMIQRAFGHDQDSTVVGWAPFFHDQGLIGNVLQPPCAGATSILMSPMTFVRWPLRWLAAISRYRAHTSGGPNFAFDACAERAARVDIPGLDLSSWKIAFNGAEPIRPETLRRFSRVFAPYGFRPEAFYPCYGIAEATLFVSGSRKCRGPRLLEADAEELRRGRYAPARDGSGQTLVGSGLISVPEWQESEEPEGPDVQIVDPETGHPRAAGQVGEIWVAGPHVAQGYWRHPEATAASFHAALRNEPGRRYLRTGDLGFVADGELYVAGRLKDLVIIRGRNYYPQDIEHTVQSAHPALRPTGCAAFSVAGTLGERLVVVQEVKPREALLADVASIVSDIRAAVIRDYQLAVSDLVLTLPGQLQKTSSGKIMRAAARRRYLEAGFRVWAPPSGERTRP
jgi:acyl-CoA synthetase (AMP-forming)/AMP-acid ligase II